MAERGTRYSRNQFHAPLPFAPPETAAPVVRRHRTARGAARPPHRGRVHRARVPGLGVSSVAVIIGHRVAQGALRPPHRGKAKRARLPQGIKVAPAPPLPNFRKSRKQFHRQLPASPVGLSQTFAVPGHRKAVPHRQPPWPGRVRRTRSHPPLVVIVATARRHKANSQPPPPRPGEVRRTHNFHSGQTSAPVVLKHRRAHSPPPPPLPGNAERRTVYHTGQGATPVVGRHRLARAPRRPPHKGHVRRGTVYHSGLVAAPVVPRSRVAVSFRPEPQRGRVRRGRRAVPQPATVLVPSRRAVPGAPPVGVFNGATRRPPLAHTGATNVPACPYRPARPDNAESYLQRPDSAPGGYTRPDECR